MIFNVEDAKVLQALVHPDVEKAVLLLLDVALRSKESIQDNPLSTDAELRQYQGQRMIISELKQYRTRLKDVFTREKERKQDDHGS